MRLLFVIFVLSVAALIWIAFAIARHIRASDLSKNVIVEASDEDLAGIPLLDASPPHLDTPLKASTRNSPTNGNRAPESRINGNRNMVSGPKGPLTTTK